MQTPYMLEAIIQVQEVEVSLPVSIDQSHLLSKEKIMKVKETYTNRMLLLLVQKSHQLIILLLSSSIFIFLALIFLSNPFQWQPLNLITTTSQTTNRPGTSVVVEECDIFSGEWISNPNAPYYTNTTCRRIHEQQNCMKYGRPDSEFIKWRWKPHGCELPLFSPGDFLELMRGKSMAFVGDSMGRNQMESLICLLSRVQHPINDTRRREQQRWKYIDYNFTVALFWSPHLVRSEVADTNGVFNLYLDEVDQTWIGDIDEFDYLIISGGHWFLGPMIFYENRTIVGCQYCGMDNVTDLTNLYYGFRKAFRTVLGSLNNNYTGVTYLRTYSPAHYEGGAWNQGGHCPRTRPFNSNQTVLADADHNHYSIQIQEFTKATNYNKNKFRLLDTTHAMLLRPDGHPSKYGHWVHQNATLHNDCLHWCLPGPIDSWTDMLHHMLKLDAI